MNETPDKSEANELPATEPTDTAGEDVLDKGVIKIGSQRDRPEREPTAADVAQELVKPAQAFSSESIVGDAESKYPPPRVQRMPEDLQREIDESLGGLSIDELMKQGAGGTRVLCTTSLCLRLCWRAPN